MGAMINAGRYAQELWVCQLGTIPYREALLMQEQVAAGRRAGKLPDTLLLLEHPPVYTRGRRSLPGELTLGEDFYRARGIDVVPTDRGGRVTYHGPGQLVGYPIMGAEDVVAHLRTIEDAIVAALAEEGIAARSRPQDGPDYTGVWVQERKLASLGVHVSRGVSTHGFAVNVENDLEPFGWVIACGLPDVEMTSIAAERARGGAADAGTPESPCVGDRRSAGEHANAADAHAEASFDCFRRRVAHRFCLAHGRRQRLVSPQQLGIALPERSALWRGTTPRPHQPRAALAHVDDPKVKAVVPA
jgi:lipoyl(octanoyl) transferase